MTDILFVCIEGHIESHGLSMSLHRIYFHLGSQLIKFTVLSYIYQAQALDLHIDPTNTKLAENTIDTQGQMIWNSINKAIRNCCSLFLSKNPLEKIIPAKWV